MTTPAFIPDNPGQPAPALTGGPASAAPPPAFIPDAPANDSEVEAPGPEVTGQMINDVGNTVIVPKDGEPFSDTMKRAVAYHQSLSPEERRAAIGKEVATMPAKTAQTLAAAASIGLVGPAMLAAPGAAVDLAKQAIPSVLAHTTEGVKAITSWVGKNPVQAYIMYHLLRELIPGAKKAMGIVEKSPDVQ